MSPLPTLAQHKDDQRLVAKEQRKVAAQSAGIGADKRFTENLMGLAGSLGIDSTSVVAGYWAMSNELSVTNAMTRMMEQPGATCVLPVIVGKDTPLIFREWHPGLALESGGFGTRHPPVSSPERIPDVLMIPLLAFDTSGHRLGWGGGFYDRTIGTYRARKHPIVAIGAAYAAQQMSALPHDDLDQRVDWIVTETSVIQAERP